MPTTRTSKNLYGALVQSPPIRRAFWSVLLLLHVVGLKSAVTSLSLGGAEVWLRFAALTLSMLFFALKIADVACLRLNSNWTSTVAAVVAVCLIHTNVLRQATDGGFDPVPATAAVVISAAVAAGMTERVRRHISRALARVAELLAHGASLLRLVFWGLAEHADIPRPGLLQVHCISLRAPPARF